MNATCRRLVGPAALAAFLMAATALPALAGFEEKLEFSADALVVQNLIGEITVKGHSGDKFEVTVSVQGSDASRDRIQIESEQDRNAELRIVFPVREDRRYVYPRLGSGSSSFTFSKSDRGWMGHLLGDLMGKRIKVAGRGSGLEVWADVEILVPRGGQLSVRHGVGEIVATSVDGNLELATHSGGVEARNVRGELIVDTGSGHVEVEDVDGPLSVDTGSGRVEGTQIAGDTVHVDTGSGSVRLNHVDTDRLHVDTGSGAVRATHIATNSADIDTGSGSVRLGLDRMGGGNFRIDTGSGGVTLGLPADASARISAETGGGGIDVDFDGARLKHHDRDEAELTIGGGSARVKIDTGSGGVRITRETLD